MARGLPDTTRRASTSRPHPRPEQHKGTTMRRPRLLIRSAIVATAILAVVPAAADAKHFAPWAPAVPETGINTAFAEGCPIESPDGLHLYIASNRPGGTGNPDANDIWTASRARVTAPWGALVNLGEPVNSTAADYCPTPLTGKRLLFVSTRAIDGACGGGDIYLSRRSPSKGWKTPRNLGCAATGDGPNFPTGEFGPSLVSTAQGTFLYFSSAGFGGDQNIYVSRMTGKWTFGPATVVSELSGPFEDMMPNVSRNGLEVVFNSNRPDGLGGQDIWTSHRASTADPWGTPVNLGPAVNSGGNETRSSLSGDGTRLHFGRDGDIYVSTRTKVTHSH